MLHPTVASSLCSFNKSTALLYPPEHHITIQSITLQSRASPHDQGQGESEHHSSSSPSNLNNSWLTLSHHHGLLGSLSSWGGSKSGKGRESSSSYGYILQFSYTHHATMCQQFHAIFLSYRPPSITPLQSTSLPHQCITRIHTHSHFSPWLLHSASQHGPQGHVWNDEWMAQCCAAQWQS